MNRPIFIIVIGYIIGIIWGLYFKTSIVSFYILLLAIYIIINLPYKKKKFKLFSIKRYFRYIKLILKFNIILTIIISSVISNMIIKYQNNKYENLYKDVQNLESTAVVVSNKQEKDYYDRYKIKICEGKYKNTNLYLAVDKEKQLEYGDKILISGEFQEPQSARNYKGFDYKQYLKTLKIYGTIKSESVKVLEKNQANPLLQAGNTAFLEIKNNIEKTYNKNISVIVEGIMLGYTDGIDEEIREDFSKSNISHVLAVSGMHILYIIILVTNSTEKILGKRKSKIISSGVLFAYMFITGFSISVVRASIMGILTCMSFIVYRKSDTLNNISISALIILINNPFSITSTSFLLTYGGTLGIIYFEPIVEKIIKSVKVKNRKWKYVFLRIQRKCEKIIEIISVSISAQIVIAPIMALKFNTLGLGFLITNLLLSCVIGIIVIGGFIQILVSLISVEAGIELAKIIQIPVYGLILISKINIWNFKVVTPDLYQVILYYICICVIRYLYKIFHFKHLSVTQKRMKNIIYLIKYMLKPYRNKIVLGIVSILFLCILLEKIPHDLKIYFIDVGQGDSTLIVTPNDKTILIDGGGSNTYDVGENILIPYLLDRKIKKIDYVISSHADQDHIGGLLSVLEELTVGKVIIGEQGEESNEYEKLCRIVKEKEIPVVVARKGDVINIEKDVKIRILFPSDELIKENVLNNNSLVTKFEYKDFKMLCTGDIESVAEKEILKMYSTNDLKSNVLKVPHHRIKHFFNRGVFRSCFADYRYNRSRGK